MATSTIDSMWFQAVPTTQLSPLHVAAMAGDSATVEQLCTDGAPISHVAQCHTPLSLAALHGKSTVCEILVKKGAARCPREVNIGHLYSYSALRCAVRSGYVDTILAVGRACRNIDHVDYSGDTALDVAVRTSTPAAIAALLYLGASPPAHARETPSWNRRFAVKESDDERVRPLPRRTPPAHSSPGVMRALREGGPCRESCLRLLFAYCSKEEMVGVEHISPALRDPLLRWRRAVDAKRDAGCVFRAAAEGRPLELQKRLRLGKLAGALTLRGRVTADGPLVTPLEAAYVGRHRECIEVLEAALGLAGAGGTDEQKDEEELAAPAVKAVSAAAMHDKGGLRDEWTCWVERVPSIVLRAGDSGPLAVSGGKAMQGGIATVFAAGDDFGARASGAEGNDPALTVVGNGGLESPSCGSVGSGGSWLSCDGSRTPPLQMPATVLDYPLDASSCSWAGSWAEGEEGEGTPGTADEGAGGDAGPEGVRGSGNPWSREDALAAKLSWPKLPNAAISIPMATVSSAVTGCGM